MSEVRASPPEPEDGTTDRASDTISRVPVWGLRELVSRWAIVGGLLVFSFWLGSRFGGSLPFGNGADIQLTTWQPGTESTPIQMVTPANPTRRGAPVKARRSGTGRATGTINLNTASADDLRRVLHMYRSTAERIVLYRQHHGPFSGLADLLAVPLSHSIIKRIGTHVRFH